MTDTAPPPPPPPDSAWGQQLTDMLLQIAGAGATYKVAQLNAKTNLALAKGKSNATNMDTSSTVSALKAYAPWIAGGLVVLAVFVALRR